ncbi:uncharacterized protein LOC130744447 [Lotus japonicus]|uniref:uncharacterized protein LOC130744447 n=1 Tax=Lotus japonicus TaxID=34305 RepID=UPI00258E332E|nr:uncharacterized protein LOC130744447 [Lotus japonicus]
MKILNLNVRGLANRVKWRGIRELVVAKKVEMILIQETKLQTVDALMCGLIWGDNDFEWKVVPAVNRAGGLLCVWRKDLFVLQNVMVGVGFMGLVGTWGIQTQVCAIVNVYSPCNLEEKRRLWAELVAWRHASPDTSWCVASDFHAVRCTEERKGVAVLPQGGAEMEEFNRFIDTMEVMDIPLVDRKFTWFRLNDNL